MQITITAKTIRRLLIVLVVAACAVIAVSLLRTAGEGELPDQLASSKYEAVTLTGGDIYFGDLQPSRDGYLELRKAHRITQKPGEKQSDKPTTQVVPVTGDAIEPQSSIFITEDQILLVQSLKKDSVVSKIINSGKS